MTWFVELAPCDYFGGEQASVLRAVGWLEQGKPFPVGAVDRRVYGRLIEMRQNPWQPAFAAGLQSCSLGQYEPEAHGGKNLFIPGNGFQYVCPELITHYMNAHGYAPPREFCDAVLACPTMRSAAYHKALLANGGRLLLKLGESSPEENLP